MSSSVLDRLIPDARLTEIDCVDLNASPAEVWERLRHGAIAQSRLTRALFAIRTLLGRQDGDPKPSDGIRIEQLTSSPERPGFQILIDEPPREVAVGAIGKVWQLEIPFVHVRSAEEYAAFAEQDFIKVAWAIRVSPKEKGRTRVAVEVRVDATDELAWLKFRRYFRVIGPASRFIRHSALRALRRRYRAS
jgi:hypothetical protein